MVIARHAQSTQNSKFSISLQYLKKERRDEVNFWRADKHHTILRVEVINLGGHSQACANYPNNKFAKFLQYLKKEMKDEVVFLWR